MANLLAFICFWKSSLNSAYFLHRHYSLRPNCGLWPQMDFCHWNVRGHKNFGIDKKLSEYVTNTEFKISCAKNLRYLTAMTWIDFLRQKGVMCGRILKSPELSVGSTVLFTCGSPVAPARVAWISDLSSNCFMCICVCVYTHTHTHVCGVCVHRHTRALGGDVLNWQAVGMHSVFPTRISYT